MSAARLRPIRVHSRCSANAVALSSPSRKATSLLDIPSERLVQDALHTVLTGRTAVIIAHRLSTVAIADRVLVMEDGQVIEDGSPGQLLTTDGEYAALHADWLASLA